MSWRIEVEHHSRYEYAGLVYSSYNEARITPMSTPWQLVLDAQVNVEPGHQTFRYLDYWGTVVHAFDIQQPHRAMTVVGRSVVETQGPALADTGPGWGELHGDEIRDDFAELLAPTRYVPIDERILAVADELRTGASPDGATRAAIGWVGERAQVCGGDDRGPYLRGRSLGRRPGGLPGLRPPGPGGDQGNGRPGPVLLGVPAPGTRRGRRSVP